MLSLGMRLPRKTQKKKTRTLHMSLVYAWCMVLCLCVLCDLVNYCMMVGMPCFMCVVEYLCA